MFLHHLCDFVVDKRYDELVDLLTHLCLSLPSPQVGHVDNSGRCVLVHAAQKGHLAVLCFLLQSANWSCNSCCGQRGVSKCQAVQQALTAAASMGHTEVRYTHTQTHFYDVLLSH